MPGFERFARRRRDSWLISLVEKEPASSKLPVLNDLLDEGHFDHFALKVMQNQVIHFLWKFLKQKSQCLCGFAASFGEISGKYIVFDMNYRYSIFPEHE
jgi:hypothetical protein